MNISSRILKPFIKWPGGKTRELDIIFANFPATVQNYYEPFIGGGAVFFAFTEAKHYFINDKSTPLVRLYQNIATSNPKFISQLESLNQFWFEISSIFKKEYQPVFYEYFKSSRFLDLNKETRIKIKSFCRKTISRDYSTHFSSFPTSWKFNETLFKKELCTRFASKIITIRRNEIKKGKELCDVDIAKNLLTGFKESFYYYLRELLNHPKKNNVDLESYSVVYYFIRMNCYSSMFRYNKDGEFNVPYGGMSYNSNSFENKIKYIQSVGIKNHLQKTTIENKDFNEFMQDNPPQEGDFIFLDPPYDTEFSTYEGSSFIPKDQERLAKYLIYDTKAQWMMVIKNTEFIHQLYANKSLVKIKSFDKNYGVSFQNRNNKSVTHLLITNY